MKARKTPSKLRSARWFAPDDLRSSGHRSRTMQMGYAPEEWAGKPVIAILNTWSDANPCHAHFKHRVEDVKRGIFQAGGFPLELPALSLSESYVKPTTMLYRNLLAMEAEELLRSHPVDGAVLMGGCDKTTPGLVMGALSMGLPMIYLPAGPMLRGNYRGEYLGSGSDAWKFWDERRAGTISETEWVEVEAGIARSYGHCMTMGTASTMTAIAEALGLTLPGASSIPAADSNHIRMSSAVGRRIVEMVFEDLVPAKIVTQAAVDNAVTVAMATGCSANAIVHLVAMARRAGIPLTLDDLDHAGRYNACARQYPPDRQDLSDGGFLLCRRPEGADGKALLKLDLSTMTVTGATLGETLEGARCYNDDVIRSLDNPLYHEGSLAVLKGNLAPTGAVIKPAACDPRFHKHGGPALVFDSYPDMKEGCRRRNPRHYPGSRHGSAWRRPAEGGPGMPEWGMLPMPKALLKKGYRDMLRLSDARMSGTSYGACILHISPESHVGGPLALLKTGDIVRLDLEARRIDMLVDDDELARRRAAWVKPAEKFGRGYGWMFVRHIAQADKGCDFDFSGNRLWPPPDEPDIY